MRVVRLTRCWSLMLGLVLCGSLHMRGENPSPGIQKSCQQFVRGFYNWYAPKAQAGGSVAASDLALKQRRALFSAELVRALREDSEAQASAHETIVGLDFDPFIHAQDTADRYATGKITIKGNTCWAEVYGIQSGKKGVTPDITPELLNKNGRWIFVNFHYPNASRPEFENLLDLLKSLRNWRRKHSD